MDTIQVTSTTTIRARSHVNNGDSPEQIELNPWDLRFLLLEYAQKGLLFQKPNISSPRAIQHLKDSLSYTLDFFMPLAGRLAIVHQGDDGDSSSVSITCNNAGVSFVHAMAENTTMADILEPTYVPPIVECFFPSGKSKNFEGTHIPLMIIQVTELVDAMFIALSMNHCLGDARPLWCFWNTWAEISRDGINYIKSNSELASFERWFAHDNIKRPIQIPFGGIDECAESLHTPPLSKRIFHFKRDKIVELKAKANSEVNDSVLTNKVSSLQTVISHIWRCAIKNLHLDPEEEVYYGFPISAISRISSPPISDNYFGNTVHAANVTMKVRDLVGVKGQGKFALEMNKVISSYTEEKIKSEFEALIPDATVSSQDGKFGKIMHTGGCHRLNFYAIDFGWGRPLGIRGGSSYMFNWKLLLYAGAEENSFEIEVCMTYEILEAMERDHEFMDAVSPPPPLPVGLSKIN